nr:Ras-related protein RABE1c [Ipomoea batatas]
MCARKLDMMFLNSTGWRERLDTCIEDPKLLTIIFLLTKYPNYCHGQLCFGGAFGVSYPSYYRGAMGILLVYDVTDESSFNNIRNWIRNIEQHASDNVNKILVGNKADMDESKRAVPTSKGQALADEYGIKFFETVSILEQPIKTFNVGFFSYLLV